MYYSLLEDKLYSFYPEYPKRYGLLHLLEELRKKCVFDPHKIKDIVCVYDTRNRLLGKHKTYIQGDKISIVEAEKLIYLLEEFNAQ